MSAKNTNEPPALSIDFIETLPGLFTRNSKGDKEILARRRRHEQKPSRELRLAGELVQHGLLSEDEIVLMKSAMSIELIFDPVAENLDADFLVIIDLRLRFCRAILSINFALDWDDDGNPVWLLDDPPEGDPLDEIGVHGVNLSAGTHEYYALKILRHFRRFKKLHEHSNVSSMGIWRELILFGETWSQARFVLNLGKHTLAGSKQNKVLTTHRRTAHARQREAVRARREAISILLREKNRNLTGGALEKHVCRQLLDRFDIKAAPRTVRRDLSAIQRS